ncbi:hypothetical protein UABAM_04563 [Candidatus Uabimicrobium amorphum]|uniref:Uncharacterized protein n=1 Tax=Uabimicrobium amorphum TaxID=2596890 RepID=A0A5S9IR33_UABAM|nr:hypothetical protein [Candidatus Uabimicrobium amorphum]BBM86177.1 hypothetical protein UABAM_04563 [Candidatus Uabimicrobium amorphum]
MKKFSVLFLFVLIAFSNVLAQSINSSAVLEQLQSPNVKQRFSALAEIEQLGSKAKKLRPSLIKLQTKTLLEGKTPKQVEETIKAEEKRQNEDTDMWEEEAW